MDKFNTTDIFSARRKINTILDKLDEDNVSFEDVENAIIKLSKFDNKQLLDILLKRLAGSNNDFYVANYILRELSDESIIPEIIELIFNKSLSDEKKAILISLLDEMNVDLESLNFNEAFDDIEKIGKMAVDSLLNELNNDFFSLDRVIEWLYDIPEESRISFINAICDSQNEQAFKFLQKLLTSDDKELVIQIFQKLSKLSTPAAMTAIRESIPYITDEEVKNIAERSLRKLSFKGVTEPKREKGEKPQKLGQVYKVYITNIDGVGSQSLWISRTAKKKVECMFLLLNEKIGIKDCFGNKMTKKQFDDMISHQFDEGIIINEISYEKALSYIKDALHVNQDKKIRIAPAFHFLKGHIIEETALVPEEYRPVFPGYDLPRLENDREMLKLTELILDTIPECESWFIINDYIYDIAEELLNKEGKQDLVAPPRKKLKEVVKAVVEAEVPYLRRRLFLTADLLNSRTSEDPDLQDQVRLLLCAALNIDKKHETNPFLLSIADDSIYQAELSLLNGFDFRTNPEFFN